jgi:hypothetical protein
MSSNPKCRGISIALLAGLLIACASPHPSQHQILFLTSAIYFDLASALELPFTPLDGAPKQVCNVC